MSKLGVRNLEISPDQSGRRLDNYLVGILKNVPKSFIYRIIRRGEVRVNGSRSRPDTRLAEADVVRLPPMTAGAGSEPAISPAKRALVGRSIVYENDSLLVLNKPAGLAVHGGSGLRFGIIDIIRELRPGDPDIELVHRLDRDTSGCLVFAKNYPTLREAQAQLASEMSEKTYLTLLRGEMSRTRMDIDLSLATTRAAGEKRTVVSADGKHALTKFTVVDIIAGMTLAEARISTGRTHQIRVHAAASGHPVAGDKKYGDPALNTDLRPLGLRRMFLHAASVTLRPRAGSPPVTFAAPLPEDLAQFLDKLRCQAPA